MYTFQRYFNSHAHVERDLHVQSLAEQPTDFNSHAHVERDRIFTYFTDIDFISTHTLTWSVTKKLNTYYRLKGISTHTLTWSVTGSRQRSA